MEYLNSLRLLIETPVADQSTRKWGTMRRFDTQARRLIRKRDELLAEISGLPFGSKQRADKHREVAPIESELDEYLF
jgi:hypothetical protein